jgi:signal transduction histidine kinase/CheY-like chemotaxis protein
MTVNVLGRRLPATLTYVVTLAAAFLLLALTVAAAFWQAEVSENLNQQVRDSSERRSHYRVLMQRVTDAETAQRGYLLLGDVSYLGPFLGARTDAEREVAALEEDARRHPQHSAEVARLRLLTDRKFDEMQLTLDLQRRGRGNEARLIVATGSGKEVMDEMRALFDHVEARETALLMGSLAQDDSAGRRQQFVILFAGLLILGIGALLLVTVRGAMRELRRSRDEARDAHQLVVQEMSAREQAESKVRQMQKMEAVGQITGGIAHDFNNMLAVIMSALHLAKRRMERGEPGAESFIDAAVDGARRAATLTSRLLAFARRKPLSPSVIDANRVLGDMSELLRRTLGEQIALETVLAGGLWRVNVDRAELEQAILNVCVNARDAMGAGGKLTIESGNAFLDEAYAGANIDVSPGQYVLVAITDTGAGMNAETRAKAFEPFFTTKEVGKGTGLGLSQVHGFLKQSGGHAAIYSEIGVGTTVKLYLPRTHLAESEDAAAAPETETFAGDPATIILVVEDDERVRTLSVASLRELGYTVLHASGGRHALDLMAANAGVALLFTDVVMPEMSGKVLADEARTRNPALKVLYTTGYTQNAIVHNGVLDADARLLLKPYSLNELARKVRAVLNE